MLLLCSDRRNVVMSAWGIKYKLRAIFEVGSMHVLEGDNLEVENTFYVRSGNKTVELYTTSAREKTEWMDTLWSVIQDYGQRLQSFRKGDESVSIVLWVSHTYDDDTMKPSRLHPTPIRPPIQQLLQPPRRLRWLLRHRLLPWGNARVVNPVSALSRRLTSVNRAAW